MLTPEDLRVNGERLNQALAELARIGVLDGGGVCRLAFTHEDAAGRDYVEAWMRTLGLAIHIDAIGNMLGVREGTEPGPLILMGSHTDTVGTGGRYDGSLGVLAGLEVLQTLNDRRIQTRLPVGVISFVNEEGVRFMPDMMGSLFMRGDLATDEVRSITGIDGSTIGANIDEIAYAGSADFTALNVGAFLELHIEQGPVLEQEGLTIAAVDGVQGITWIRFSLQGATAHAGATPIAMRRDAGYVAGCILQFARQLSTEIKGQRATVGSLTLEPNLVNVVAEQATLTVDLRNPDAAQLQEATDRLLTFVADCAEAEGVSVTHEILVDVAPVTFDANLVAIIEQSARALDLGTRRLTSGAGHDAQILATKYPAAMIFVPSVGGISHNITEYTKPEDVVAGANVLLQSILRLTH